MIRNQKGGIRDQKGGIRDQKGGIWDHSPGIRNLTPWDRDQQFFEGAGIRLYVFGGRSGTKICNAFGIKGQKLGYKMGSPMKEHTSLWPCYLVSKEKRIT